VKERKGNRWRIYKKDVMRNRRKEPKDEGNMKNRGETQRKEVWGQRERKTNNLLVTWTQEPGEGGQDRHLPPPHGFFLKKIRIERKERNLSNIRVNIESSVKEFYSCALNSVGRSVKIFFNSLNLSL
jgi:hypothetical protein